MQSYKAIISDYDGTLAGKDWQISVQVQSSITQWIQSGHLFMIATGKQYKHIASACKLLRLTTPQIVRGGSEIVDGQTGKLIHAAYVDPTELQDLIRELLQSKIPFTAEKDDYLYTIDGKPCLEVPGVQYKKITEEPLHDIPKLVLWTNELEDAYVENYVNTILKPKFKTVAIEKSYTPYLKTWQITSIQGTKFAAVQHVCKLISLDSDNVIGIGDSFNDLPLLQACGLKVAMGNAPESLKKIADLVVPSIDKEGMASLIQKLMTSNLQQLQ